MPIAGASRYLNASSVANLRSIAPSVPTLLSQSTSTTSMLDSGRRLAVLKTGVSSSARALNSQFLSQSKSLGNQILSLGVGIDATVDGAKLQINALRGRYSESQIARSLRGTEVDKTA